jgi:predicted DNA-binding protein
MAEKGRPRTGQTPNHTVRVPDERWQAAKAKAEREGRTLASVINDCLERYLRKST